MDASPLPGQSEHYRHADQGIYTDRQEFQGSGKWRILAGVRFSHRNGAAGIGLAGLVIIRDVGITVCLRRWYLP